MVFGDISGVFYWCVHHMERDNGQDIGAHPKFGLLSSLPPLLFFGCVCPLCVSRSKERPSSTELARGTKWRPCFRSCRFLARTSTLKVRLSRFPYSLKPPYHRHLTPLPLFAIGFRKAINIGGGKKDARRKKKCVCVISEGNL